MASSIGSTIASFGASYIPDLSDTANIQTALKYLYYGSTGAANTSNGIYGALYTLFSGSPTFAGDVTITGNLTVNGSTTTVNSTTITLDDKNIELLSTGTATDVLADGGGITLKGTTDKTFNYVNSTTAWTSNQNIDIVSTGTAYKIAGTNVLTSTQVLGKTPGGTSAGDIATIDGTQKLTNKSLSDSSTYIVDATDNTKRINIDVTGTTNITGILQTAFTTAKTIAFPDLAGTVALTSLAGGGTNGSLTASNGGIVWSDASQFQILAGTATANKILMSGATATPSWSIPTYPNASATLNTFIRSDGTNYVASTVTIPATLIANQLMYASSTTAITGLATANSGVLVTDGTGVPSISSTLPANLTLTTPTIDIINAASASGTSSSLYNNLTTGTMAIGSALTTGVINIATATGFTSITGGQSVINIATGANTANTKTVNIGNAGTGGTSVINLGTSGAAGTQTINTYGSFKIGGTTTIASGVSGTVTLPSTAGTLMDNKMTTIGDILYASATGTPATYTRLAGNTATQPSFLSSTGNGTANTTTAFTSSTGSGNVVLVTSPTFATSVIGSASMDVFNTVSTTLNIGGAATTLTLGNTATAAQTVNMFTASTGGGTYNFATAAATASKTINIGTNTAAAGSTTINIGTTSAATTGTTVSIGNNTASSTSTVNLYGQTYVGKSTAGNSTGTVTGYSTNLLAQSTSNANAGALASVNGSDLFIKSGDASLPTGLGNAQSGSLTLDVGDPTATSGTISYGTINIGTKATVSNSTKTINIGTGGATGSTTNIFINNTTAGAGGTNTIGGNTKFNGIVSTNAAAPTIASATTIAPTTQILFVSGTTAIATITAPAPISTTGGQITIIPTGTFTTTTAGNIALASTAAINKALIMTYDSTTAKWYPSY